MIIKPIHTGASLPCNAIAVPRQTSFYVPEGYHCATIKSVSKRFRQSGSSSIPIVRLVFSVSVPGSFVDYLAKVDLKQDMHEGSDLCNVLSRLVGRKRLQECSGKEFDLNSLVGISCDIEIEYVRTKAEDYDFPLVVVTNVQAAGSLIKREAEEGK